MNTNIFLYDTTPLLPKGFYLPDSYTKYVERNSTVDLEPWEFLCNDLGLSLYYYGAILSGDENRPLIPFAIINDESGLYNDGYVVLACFDGTDLSGDPKVYFHDYSSTKKNIPWEERYFLNNFDDWLKLAKEESAQYKSERSELNEN